MASLTPKQRSDLRLAIRDFLVANLSEELLGELTELVPDERQSVSGFGGYVTLDSLAFEAARAAAKKIDKKIAAMSSK